MTAVIQDKAESSKDGSDFTDWRSIEPIKRPKTSKMIRRRRSRSEYLIPRGLTLLLIQRCRDVRESVNRYYFSPVTSTVSKCGASVSRWTIAVSTFLNPALAR